MESRALEQHKRHITDASDEEDQQQKRLRHAAGMEALPRTSGRQYPDGQQVEHQQAVVVAASVVHPPSPPESEEEDDVEDEEISSSSSSSSSEEENVALAGYEYCSREAIRYLLEEEKLDRNHPVILQLQQHLESRRNHVVGGGPPPPRADAP